TEIKRAQVEGLADYPVFTRKVHTDVSYLACARGLLAARIGLYPQFATHNAFTIAAVQALAGDADYEFQCLHGMGETIYDPLVGVGEPARRCRIYAPVGSHETLLGYLVRRLLENGANTSFVNQIVDPKVSIADIVADPVAQALAHGGTPHPRIPLPESLFEGRRNSRGFDGSDDVALTSLARELVSTPVLSEAGPLVGDVRATHRRTADQRANSARARVTITNPADRADEVGTVAEATLADVTHAIDVAVDRAPLWRDTAVDDRATMLERAADLIEQSRARLLALLVREAGRTLSDAVAEVREAVDFCRYYAQQARSDSAGVRDAAPRGPIVAISPWNFPLSIFVGQIAAALVTGNPVLAKPAEQTPLVSALAVSLMHAAGVPGFALQLLPGRGDSVGAALVADPRIAGVVFTGSTDVARTIHRVLAERADDPVLIAETGGQNALIVDSSALPEQVVADVLVSAFDSAGQRCSALRVLCLQEDIAPALLHMLEGAMHELTIGDPRHLATDVGPVIDAQALGTLQAHVEQMRSAGMPIVEAARAVEPDRLVRGSFMRPTLIDLGGIDGLARLTREVFGPVLHVVRWRRDELDLLVERINAAGYGLTHGIHTRIDDTVAAILSRIRAGNVYVNRNMIGAVVGVQPFGGLGLSGTGPKAGGPLYLRRLCRPQAPFAFPSDRRMHLPGPTGESNELEFRPRGVIACVARDERSLRAQARLAQSLGNRTVMLQTRVGMSIRQEAEYARVELVERLDPGCVDAVLLDVPAQEAALSRRAFAAAPGTIVPIITPDAQGRYDATRLVVERTVTINTAAAGGNAKLLALAADEVPASH
ncbi:MAG: bifunctional proline dehydrogenase/L-glutamate gamma-semialdehyde dehydrogenase PutA, partial [Pseudomonadota bacterium]|nr:bifunctional proline dehydrogenase/L-glutamate gamma-semialdehyde dehydrogenase PutA [Pseudomonadota bacterium]